MRQYAHQRSAWIQPTKRRHLNAKSTMVEEEAADSPSQHDDREKVTVAINAELLKCGVCLGQLKPPLFQCTKGHISCSECCTDGATNYECMMCRGPETATRCHAMERVIEGLSVPCAFRHHGCAEMLPYAEKQAHEASCVHSPCHCPIAGCDGYKGGSLRDHIEQDHDTVRRTGVVPGWLTALRMRVGEQARVLCLGNGTEEFLLVVGQDIQSGRTLYIIHLMAEPLVEEEFDYRIVVAGEAGILSLSGEPDNVERLTKPYQASAFLFVPNAIWEAAPQEVPVFVELK